MVCLEFVEFRVGIPDLFPFGIRLLLQIIIKQSPSKLGFPPLIWAIPAIPAILSVLPTFLFDHMDWIPPDSNPFLLGPFVVVVCAADYKSQHELI